MTGWNLEKEGQVRYEILEQNSEVSPSFSRSSLSPKSSMSLALPSGLVPPSAPGERVGCGRDSPSESQMLEQVGCGKGPSPPTGPQWSLCPFLASALLPWPGGHLGGVRSLQASYSLEGRVRDASPLGPPHPSCLQVSKQYILGVPSVPHPRS